MLVVDAAHIMTMLASTEFFKPCRTAGLIPLGSASGRQAPTGLCRAHTRDLVLVVDATHANDVALVGRIVQRAIKRAVIADGADHQDARGRHLPHLRTANSFSSEGMPHGSSLAAS